MSVLRAANVLIVNTCGFIGPAKQESLDVLRASLSSEWFSFQGQYHQIGRTSLRPRPRPG